MKEFERIFWIVLDSVGIGELPDAAEYGDVGRNTVGHIAESRPVEIPNLVRMGLANIARLKHLPPATAPIAAYGKGTTRSPGKDTTTGHWEMAGVWLDQALPVFKKERESGGEGKRVELGGRRIIKKKKKKKSIE